MVYAFMWNIFNIYSVKLNPVHACWIGRVIFLTHSSFFFAFFNLKWQWADEIYLKGDLAEMRSGITSHYIPVVGLAWPYFAWVIIGGGLSVVVDYVTTQ